MFLNIESKQKNKIAAKDNLGQIVTYGEIVDRCNELKGKGYERSIIFIMCKNTVGSLMAYLTSVESGLVPVTLSAAIDKELFESLYHTYQPKFIWSDKNDNLIQNFGQPIHYLFDFALYETGNDSYPFNDQLQLLMTTSGSTGSPKLVRYRCGNLKSNAKNVAIAFGWTENERSICDLAMNYTMGLNIINSHLYVGATCLLTTYNITSMEFWKYIKEEKGTNFCGVPFSYDILKKLRFERMSLPYLTTITEGGGKLTDKRFNELANYAKENGKRFIASFGTTETSARMVVLPAEWALSKTGSIGKAIPEGELFLIDENNEIISENIAEGELCYKGPNVTMGYAICKEDLLKGDEFNGIYRTGDMAKRDEDGFYFITGRISRFLKLLSYRVSLDQSERLIQQQFSIECACSGTDEQMNIYITDESYQDKVMDFIVQKTGLFKSLFKVVIVPQIIRNESGKIRYKQMDELYTKGK